ncbi:MAG: hypothetical protein ACQ9MH_16805 [Nitrospinales bacterium]
MENDRFLKRFIVITWALVSSLIALMILGGTMYYKIVNEAAPMPEVLKDWGGIILGFYFGSFTSLAKDALFKEKNITQR